MRAKYALHPQALRDLRDISKFIEKDSLEAAYRVVEKIYDAIRFAAEYPDLGHRRDDLTVGSLRFRRVYSYLIVYAPDCRPLTVLAIFHGRRSPTLLAAIIGSRQ